jgi:translocation and assembly module TamB
VEAPQTRLFSDPAMSDAEIMSYLVTGKPLSAASSGSDSQALAAAAASLGANSPVAAEISEKLGIDVGVESAATTGAETSLVVGKQLSPQLRVEYLYGMFTASGAIQFVYKLTRHLSLAGQSGAAQSIDLRYTISRP